MRTLGRFLIDEAHRQAWSTRPDVAARMSPANPADASYAQAALALVDGGFHVEAHTSGPITGQLLTDVDVLVLPHCSLDDWESTTREGSPVYAPEEIDAIESFVRGGGGLLILAETEQRKYGNSLADIAARFGVAIGNCTVQDPVHRFNDVSTWVLLQPQHGTGQDLFAEVEGACFYRAGTVAIDGEPARTPGAHRPVVLARSHASASPAGEGLLVGVEAGQGRVLVAADSDFAGDDSIDDLANRRLWMNMCTWLAAGASRSRQETPDSYLAQHASWVALKEAVAELRTLQSADGSIEHEIGRAHV